MSCTMSPGCKSMSTPLSNCLLLETQPPSATARSNGTHKPVRSNLGSSLFTGSLQNLAEFALAGFDLEIDVVYSREIAETAHSQMAVSS